MRVDINTAFNHVARLQDEIRAHGNSLLCREGALWLQSRFRQTIDVLAMEQRVLRQHEGFDAPDPAEFSPPDISPSIVHKTMARLRRRRVLMNLWHMAQQEKYYEQTRMFYTWIEYLEQIKPVFLRVIDEDFEDLANRIETLRLALLKQELPVSGFIPLDLEVLISWLPDGKWQVPILRGNRFILATETIPAKKMLGIIRQNVVAVYHEEFTELLKDIQSSSTETKEYLDALYAYLQGESIDQQELSEIYHRRAEPLIERLYHDLEAMVLEVHGIVSKEAAEVLEALAGLKNNRWFSVRRKYMTSGLGRHLAELGEARHRLSKMADKSESRFTEWINENIKPAMGITQRVKIQVSAAVLDPAWTKDPDPPADLSDIMLDRRNPSLLIIPAPVTETVKAVKQFYRENGYGSLLFTTDHLAGSYGMIGYLLSVYFKGEKHRIYRQSATVPIPHMAEFEENVVFIDNFEKMVLLDEYHQTMALELVEQITTSDKLMIVAVNQTVAEHLKCAIPGFSRFLYELNFVKYEFTALKKIIEKRMVISGYQFEFVDENDFWAKLYAASSGIPGVALRIFLRCIASVKEQTITLDYSLPGLKEIFGKLSLEELLFLKKIYMHPSIDIELLDSDGNGKTKTMATNLQQMGILIVNKKRYSIRPELYGALRDHLMQTNLV